MNNPVTEFYLPQSVAGYNYSWASGGQEYESGNLVSTNNKPGSFRQEDKTPLAFSISYYSDGGISTNPEPYTIEDEAIILKDATKEGCIFEFWYSEAEFVTEETKITVGSIGYRQLFAKFTQTVTGLFNTGNKTFSFYPNTSTNYIQSELALSTLSIFNREGVLVTRSTSAASKYDVSG